MKAGPVSVPSPHFAMSQATFVVGALAIGWVLWLAVNQKLLLYWQMLIGSAPNCGSSSGSSGSSSGSSLFGTPSTPAGPQSGTPAPAGQAPFTGGLL